MREREREAEKVKCDFPAGVVSEHPYITHEPNINGISHKSRHTYYQSSLCPPLTPGEG